MAKAKSGVSLGVSALIVIVLILIVGFGLFLNATFNTTSTTTIIGSASSSSFSSNTSSWQVLKTNVIVSYNAECMVLGAVGHTCPTISRNASGTEPSSLRGVELVAYQGTDYYAGNFSEGPYGQTTVSSRTVWFTNTTIYCITPPYDNYVACP
jgi:hypothetical protein